MSWFKVDDHLHSHPKARRAGLAAMGMWTLAGSWAMAFKSAGFVPEWWVCTHKTGKKHAADLVRAGLWEEGVDDATGEPGWRFHDWSHFQPSNVQIERQREKSRDRQRRFRDKQNETPNDSNGVSNGVTDGVSNGRPTRPDPTRPESVVLSVVGDGSPSPNRRLRTARDDDGLGL